MQGIYLSAHAFLSWANMEKEKMDACYLHTIHIDIHLNGECRTWTYNNSTDLHTQIACEFMVLYRWLSSN